MYTYAKDGITVSAFLDSRKANLKGKYPVKIRVTYRRERKYYSTGISLSSEEWEKLPFSKSTEYKKIRASIENSFSLVKGNTEALAERGDFSFDSLNVRLGRATGDTVNNALKAKMSILEG
jgi:hypothetical protein